MNPFIQDKNILLSLLIGYVVVWFGVLPKAHGVVPPPDGGYANFTTAEGTNALLSLTSGPGNTGVGWSSLFSVTSGSLNTGVGAGTLALNIADSNTATGALALFLNTTGANNTAIGDRALFSNTNGHDNTAVGQQALLNNTGGTNDQGSFNTAIGSQALVNNTTGTNNTVNGAFALLNNSTGSLNTVIGEGALFNNTTGNGNIVVGGGAGFFLDADANLNIVIGSDGKAGDAGTIRIGNINHTRAFIAGIRGVTTGNMDTVPVIIDSAGQLGTVSSSLRYKKEIKPMDKASEAILALKPVTFRYKHAKKDAPQFGLIAEEVASVNPDLVVHDAKGEIYTVRYDAVNAMLLNEFLKEHRKVEQLEQQVEALTAGLQNVSAQLAAASPSDGGLALSKSARRAVVRNQ
jgi:Chaperone of endosialidase